ncbi:TPA: tRNA-dihydrouridine synthase family protein [Legionella pneumophila subsp. pneumophila]|nr:tRNA-dihydrouridine synthase family protein [Legionella pneumophila]HAT9354169.1 tRNA-dihydrouridine synthase family protein [Legionella pneumophila subsp. pneumophila]HAT9368772.1 tRNA-dihydrouridine synthase family protein [Legionella pneumophila subsp. pneumophila]HAT9517840.1 tRNA-dihydrouridine synthase family protein [Legionella pneumophila subsp. pneumophila]HAT9586281.1 tRNA-dihydrouridine synthase family protein [Legionella pneumophila subsp. pneumophila]
MMHTFINSPLQIGSLKLPHRLIQGPLAGYSCAPFRDLFNIYTPPAYCVSEMCSAIDILHKHSSQSRYIYRAPTEKLLAYQISGNEPHVLAEAAAKLQSLGADLIDINCGCPKSKIRKKGAGSALLEDPQKLIAIISRVRAAISIPLTIKIRIQNNEKDLTLAKQIEDAGAHALIVHGRRWTEDYDIPCNWQQIANIKNAVNIPVIVNGDISDIFSLRKALEISVCDGFMISRAGTGKPWLYRDLLNLETNDVAFDEKLKLFMLHLEGLSYLENEHKAVLQSKSLVRYYFKKQLNEQQLQQFYQLGSLMEIKDFLAEATHRVSPILVAAS